MYKRQITDRSRAARRALREGEIAGAIPVCPTRVSGCSSGVERVVRDHEAAGAIGCGSHPDHRRGLGLVNHPLGLVGSRSLGPHSPAFLDGDPMISIAWPPAKLLRMRSTPVLTITICLEGILNAISSRRPRVLTPLESSRGSRYRTSRTTSSESSACVGGRCGARGRGIRDAGAGDASRLVALGVPPRCAWTRGWLALGQW